MKSEVVSNLKVMRTGIAAARVPYLASIKGRSSRDATDDRGRLVLQAATNACLL